MDGVSGGFSPSNVKSIDGKPVRPRLTEKSRTHAIKQGLGGRTVKIPAPGPATAFLRSTKLHSAKFDATLLDLSYECECPQLPDFETAARSSPQVDPKRASEQTEPSEVLQKEADEKMVARSPGRTSPTSENPRQIQRQEGIERAPMGKRVFTAGRSSSPKPTLQRTGRVSEMRNRFEIAQGEKSAPAFRVTMRPTLREEARTPEEKESGEQELQFSKNEEKREPPDFGSEEKPTDPEGALQSVDDPSKTLVEAQNTGATSGRANRSPSESPQSSPRGHVPSDEESSFSGRLEPIRRRLPLSRTTIQRSIARPVAIVKKPTAMNKAPAPVVDRSYLGISPPVAGSPEYQLLRTYLEHAENLHWHVFNKVTWDGRDEYERKEEIYRHEGGDITDHYFVRTKLSRKDAVLKTNRENFEHFTRWTRALSAWTRDLAGKPRQTGGNYGSRKGDATLMPFRRVVDLQIPTVGVVLVSKQPISVAAVAATHNLSPSLGGATEGLGDFAVLPIVTGVAMNLSDSAINYFSGYAKHKWNMLRYWRAAERFLLDFKSATPQEAEAYVLFMEAAEKLVAPTKEEAAQTNALRGLAAKEVGLTPTSVTASFAGQIAVHAGASAPIVSTAVAPLSIAASGVDYYVSLQESKLQGEKKRGAKGRKQMLQGAFAGPHPEHLGVVSGVSNSLIGYQDVLIKRAKRERIFAASRGSRAAGNITSTLISVGVAGAVIGGVITVASAGTLAPAIAVPAAAGALAFFVRDVFRHFDEHGERWDQRTAQFLCMHLSRAQLEELLAKAADEDVSIKIEFQEGEYDPDPDGERRFAGKRTITVDVRENAFVGLHVLALQIQDVANGSKSLEDIAVWLDALWYLKLDAPKLIAIIKAASAKPPLEQLDFIQNKLSPLLGIKFRTVGGKQPLPHPGPFLDGFEEAWMGSGNVAESKDPYRRVIHWVETTFPANKAHAMEVFKAVVERFLQRTIKEPATPLTNALYSFLTQHDFEAKAEVNLARIENAYDHVWATYKDPLGRMGVLDSADFYLQVGSRFVEDFYKLMDDKNRKDEKDDKEEIRRIFVSSARNRVSERPSIEIPESLRMFVAAEALVAEVGNGSSLKLVSPKGMLRDIEKLSKKSARNLSDESSISVALEPLLAWAGDIKSALAYLRFVETYIGGLPEDSAQESAEVLNAKRNLQSLRFILSTKLFQEAHGHVQRNQEKPDTANFYQLIGNRIVQNVPGKEEGRKAVAAYIEDSVAEVPPGPLQESLHIFVAAERLRTELGPENAVMRLSLDKFAEGLSDPDVDLSSYSAMLSGTAGGPKQAIAYLRFVESYFLALSKSSSAKLPSRRALKEKMRILRNTLRLEEKQKSIAQFREAWELTYAANGQAGSNIGKGYTVGFYHEVGNKLAKLLPGKEKGRQDFLNFAREVMNDAPTSTEWQHIRMFTAAEELIARAKHSDEVHAQLGHSGGVSWASALSGKEVVQQLARQLIVDGAAVSTPKFYARCLALVNDSAEDLGPYLRFAEAFLSLLGNSSMEELALEMMVDMDDIKMMRAAVRDALLYMQGPSLSRARGDLS